MAEEIDRRPVQVVLDAGRFVETVVRKAGPQEYRDFFEGNDEGFRVHKDEIINRLSQIAARLRNTDSELGFVRVQVRAEALAKSHRPTKVLFTADRGLPLVASEANGELIFQVTAAALERLVGDIAAKAELNVKIVVEETTGEESFKVSKHRSEVGAIAHVRLNDNRDRVKFSARDALSWMAQPTALGGYIVELFTPDTAAAPEGAQIEMTSLRGELEMIGQGLLVRTFDSGRPVKGRAPLSALSISFRDGVEGAQVELPYDHRDSTSMALDPPGRPRRAIAAPADIETHHRLLAALAEQTLVRRVELPPVIEASPADSGGEFFKSALAQPLAGTDYPVVGVIDGGVSQTALGDWVVGDAGLVPAEHKDPSHGCFIAGLIAGASALNANLRGSVEPVGCKVFDLDLFPRRELRAEYYDDLEFFFDLVDEKVKRAKLDHHVRIFNLSFGLRASSNRFGYSLFAERLDRIALRNDVIFVVSAGNLNTTACRLPWPATASAALGMLAASSGDDGILAPAEHLCGLTVGAINPPDIFGHEPDRPTTYTRRGPGVGGARKPDLAHYGGALVSPRLPTGLISMAPDGRVREGSGTSYAAPNVASTLATLDHRLGQQATREFLLAMMVHRAQRPASMEEKSLRHVARDFVGFGRPALADVMLADDPYSITLVFNHVLIARQQLDFGFSWPRSLVGSGGGCFGRADMTLAFTPPVDLSHGEEALRVQLDASLKQEGWDKKKRRPKFYSRMKPDGSSLPTATHASERTALMSGTKWSAIKRYHLLMTHEAGITSNWKLTLEPLTRAGAAFPPTGVPFSIILTLSDPARQHAIHDELRSSLNAQLVDIRVAHRLRPRP